MHVSPHFNFKQFPIELPRMTLTHTQQAVNTMLTCPKNDPRDAPQHTSHALTTHTSMIPNIPLKKDINPISPRQGYFITWIAYHVTTPGEKRVIFNLMLVHTYTKSLS